MNGAGPRGRPVQMLPGLAGRVGDRVLRLPRGFAQQPLRLRLCRRAQLLSIGGGRGYRAIGLFLGGAEQPLRLVLGITPDEVRFLPRLSKDSVDLLPRLLAQRGNFLSSEIPLRLRFLVGQPQNLANPFADLLMRRPGRGISCQVITPQVSRPRRAAR